MARDEAALLAEVEILLVDARAGAEAADAELAGVPIDAAALRADVARVVARHGPAVRGVEGRAGHAAPEVDGRRHAGPPREARTRKMVREHMLS